MQVSSLLTFSFRLMQLSSIPNGSRTAEIRERSALLFYTHYHPKIQTPTTYGSVTVFASKNPPNMDVSSACKQNDRLRQRPPQPQSKTAPSPPSAGLSSFRLMKLTSHHHFSCTADFNNTAHTQTNALPLIPILLPL